MKLTRLTERVWIYPFEVDRDRPNLGYIRGEHWSIAIDAGHSAAHIAEFYQAIKQEGLPLPDLTVLTHWHWDHTFALHAAHGLSVANTRTADHMQDFRRTIERDGREAFLTMDPSIRKEYENDMPVIITMPAITFSGEIQLDAGHCPVRLFQATSPHTDDSTLIHLPGEGVLFLGDAAGGTFPTWERDPVLCHALVDTISGMECSICVESHWDPETKQELIDDLINA